MAVEPRGIALVEVLVSLFVLSLVFMFLMNLFPMASVATHRAGEDAQATGLAQHELEGARSTSFWQLTGGMPTPSPTPVVINGVAYRVVREVYAIPGENADLLLGVRARVTWEHGGLLRQVVQESFVPKVQR